MLIHNLIWLGGATLSTYLFAANAGRTETESGGRGADSIDLVADVPCETSRDAVETEMCASGRLRWRLCEQGFRTERLPNADVYGCFLRSN